MVRRCLKCARALRVGRERRYETVKFSERYNVGHITLDKWTCKGYRGCKTATYVRIVYPIDRTLAPAVTSFLDAGPWKRANKTKPGAEQLGTTASEFTQLAAGDPANAYVRNKILGLRA